MENHVQSGPLRVRAISGTHVVLMAFDLDEVARAGLHGFAIQRSANGQGPQWLEGLKYFKTLVPDPKKGALYSSREQPIQSFLWSDYEAAPASKYEFTVAALYGEISNLTVRYQVSFSISTEKENDGHHGIWFNRGAIASHALAAQFSNRVVTNQMFVDAVAANGQITDPEARWLSRGLAEAMLAFINSAQSTQALRVCAYEFTFLPLLAALKRAHDRGVDVQIVYHSTRKPNDPNRKAAAEAGLPESILTERTHPQIPHNKFIVKLEAGSPKQVWTGSTNFTSSALFGQTNVGHLVTDDETATTYLKYWMALSQNPTEKPAIESAMDLTPNPPGLIPQNSIREFFSPRIGDNMLKWYAARMIDAVSLSGITLPFNVAPTILDALSTSRAGLRLAILEDPPAPDVKAAQKSSQGQLLFSNGAILGKQFRKIKSQTGGAVITPIPGTKVEDWFLDEELGRPSNAGHVFFIHTKFMMVDPLSEDPLICSGSANFSTNSIIHNDENMLLIRGNERVAHIYLTEFDRIFRHFFARDWINNLAQHNLTNPLELDPFDTWIAPNFAAGSYKNSRRLFFFPTAGADETWAQNATRDDDPFADEVARGKALRAKKRADSTSSKVASRRRKVSAERASTAKRGPRKKHSVGGADRQGSSSRKRTARGRVVGRTRKATPRHRAAKKK